MTDYETRPEWAGMADCPFCSARAAEFHISVSYCTSLADSTTPSSWMGECAQCGAMGPTAPTEREAFDAWNGRQGFKAASAVPRHPGPPTPSRHHRHWPAA
jgi:hypothetical protein